MSRRRIVASLLAATAAGLLAAAPAQATFHLIKVREVHASSGAEDSYVELQMFAAGQNLLSGHKMTVYDSSGPLVHTSEFTADVASAENQRTVLIGDTGVKAATGVMPDLVDPGLFISPDGGAACWNAGGIPADCVSWGDFAGNAALIAATGTSAGTPVLSAGIPAGKAIRRTIAPGCPTLLEESDDTDDSAADFAEVTPEPRNNGTAPTERTCISTAPNTAIDDKPPLLSNSASAEFTYDAPTANLYECSLDAEAFTICPLGGPKLYTGLADGIHAFHVRGRNATGPDPTPATYTWTIDTAPPETTLLSKPPNPSASHAASFTYAASEAGSRFECSLDDAAFAACPATGVSYPALANGSHAFQVRAIDLAGNADASAASYAFTVQAGPIVTPPHILVPNTLLSRRPAKHSHDATPTFRFHADAASASFQCAVDGGRPKPCRSPFTTPRLKPGQHSFSVAAVLAGAVDPTPVRVSFRILRRG